jgi:hypothetical protein
MPKGCLYMDGGDRGDIYAYTTTHMIFSRQGFTVAWRLFTKIIPFIPELCRIRSKVELTQHAYTTL